MKVITALTLALFISFCLVSPVLAVNSPQELPRIAGEAAFLLDVQSGQVLFSKNSDERLAPASTTKIMTALLALEYDNLQGTVTVSSTMLDRKKVYGTQIYLTPGEQLPLKDILYAVLLNSANDAAVALAEHVGGDLSRFVVMMNDRAQQMGMLNTHFTNPTGLTENGHYSTAHDLALLAKAAYQNPLFLHYTETKSYMISRSKPNVPTLMVNENKLLWQDGSINGMKTGYTAQAGNCLVASATKDGRQLVGVILKSPGKEMFGDMENLLNYGFEEFDTTLYKRTGEFLNSIMVKQQPVNLILAAPIYITQGKGTPSTSLRLAFTLPASEPPEVKQGQVLGKVEVWNGGDLLNTVNLVADRTVVPVVKQHLTQKTVALYFSVAGFLLVLVLYSVLHRFQVLRLWKRRIVQRQRRESNT
ncbi:MAG: D-alanyl-D-alanine carboxypeptidase family protein [Desulfitobacteriaceae bacterium]